MFLRTMIFTNKSTRNYNPEVRQRSLYTLLSFWTWRRLILYAVYQRFRGMYLLHFHRKFGKHLEDYTVSQRHKLHSLTTPLYNLALRKFSAIITLRSKYPANRKRITVNLAVDETGSVPDQVCSWRCGSKIIISQNLVVDCVLLLDHTVSQPRRPQTSNRSET